MRTGALIAAAVFSLVGMTSNTDATVPRGFRESLLEAVKCVDAWQIEYESIVPVDVRGGPVLHQIVAMKSPNSIFHWSAKVGYGARMAWQDDPLQQRSIISQSRSYWEFPMRRAFRVTEIDDRSLFPGSLSQGFLWGAVMWWPITRESNYVFGEAPYVVVDVLESEKYRFREELEDVEGVPCYVLGWSGRSALWFDAKRIGVLMAREFYSKDTGVPTGRLEMSKHQEIKRGIWCPMEFRNIQYDY